MDDKPLSMSDFESIRPTPEMPLTGGLSLDGFPDAVEGLMKEGKKDDRIVGSTLFYCPYCLRTRQIPHLSTNVPNLRCGPHYTKSGKDFYTEMELVGSQKEVPE